VRGPHERELRARGFEAVELGVERDNPRARLFYQRAGYVVTGAEQGWFSYTPPGQSAPVRQQRDEIIMRKTFRGLSRYS